MTFLMEGNDLELHRFFKNFVSMAEVYDIWRSAKREGYIPNSWSFAKHGELRRTYSGTTLYAKKG